MSVKDIMTREVATLPPEASIRDAMELLYTNHLSGAPVVRGSSVVGVISMTDIADLLVNVPDPVTIDGDSLLDERTVADAMTRDIIKVESCSSIRSAATVMRKRKVHRVLVMDDDKLIGIVSSLDIARAISEKGIAGVSGIRLDPCSSKDSPWIMLEN